MDGRCHGAMATKAIRTPLLVEELISSQMIIVSQISSCKITHATLCMRNMRVVAIIY